MSYFGVSTRNGVGLGLGTVPSLTNTPLGYRLAPSLDLSFAGSDTLSPLITFSRTTSATVTGSNGLIQNAPMNLLTFSEQFDNAAWSKTNATVTANNTAAPNGTTTADKLISNNGAATNTANTTQTVSAVSGTVYTYSCYAKSAGAANIRLRMTGSGTWASAIVDLNTGVISGALLTGTATATAVGNGWYRITISAASDFTGTNTAFAYPYDAGNGTDGVFIWGAQLELGSTATTYNPTTVKNLLGFTENFDNAAWTKSNAFVQTNLLLQSEDFTNAAWTLDNGGAVNPVVTANAGVAPNGTLTADRIVLDKTGGTFSRIQQSVAATASVVYTFSVYLKTFSGGTSNVGIRLDATGINVVVTGEWQRFNVTALTVGTIAGQILLFDSIIGNDETADVLAWGAQLVQGTSAGDYKATYAAAAAVGYTDIYGQPFAQKLVENTAASSHFTNQTATVVNGSSYTYSVYAKKGERNYVSIFCLGTTATANTFFNLNTGVVVSTSANATSSIQDIGNGWYRCSVTATTNATTSGIYPGISVDGVNASYTGDGTSGIYIFGAQLSDSASVDPYVYQPVAAPSSVAYYGPRFDYDPVTLAPKGLLIEEQRANLILQSENFSASWSLLRMTNTADALVSPDGRLTADLLLDTAVAGTHVAIQIITKAASSIVYTASVYLKAGVRTLGELRVSDQAGNGVRNTFNLAAGTVGTPSAFGIGFTAGTSTITSVGNGWYRVDLVVTSNIAVTLGQEIYIADGSGNTSYTGNGSGFYAWGAQLEQGAFQTSYIPTGASQVTRAADSASMIGNNFARWYNPNAGTFSVGFSSQYSGNPGSTPTQLAFTNLAGASGFISYWNNAVVSSFDGTNAANANIGVSNWVGPHKVASAYGGTTKEICANAGTVGSSAYTGAWVAAAGLTFAPRGWISRTAFYGRKLSSTELRGITS